MFNKTKVSILFLIITLFGAACGSPTPVITEAPATEQASGESAFPLTIEHKYGSTIITEQPERVVSLGFTDQDYLLALGVVPVGIRDWFGEQPNAVWPWARELLGGAEPVVVARELNFEQIAELQPDLIVAIYTSLTQDEYDLLSKIAPTVTGPAELDEYAITWQEQTRFTGKIVGQSQLAEELVTQLEGKIEKARADHPEFEGKDYAFASAYGGEYYLFGKNSTASRFLTSLGFVAHDEMLELTTNDNDYFVFSAERMDLLDRSLTLWSEGTDDEGVIKLLKNPLYTKLDVHTEGRDIFLGLDLYGGAFSFSSILSLDLLVDELVPAMALAIDGDPSTVPTLGKPATAAYPVTIEHKYGSTTITEFPERIVLVGLTDQDALLALGIVPVATREWWGERPGAIFEWATDELGNAPLPEVLPGTELNFEQIAALNPDVIIGLYAGTTQEEYDTLSKIAPVVAQPAEYPDWGIPWQDSTRTIGLIVGKSERAEELIAEVDARFAQVREEHPEFSDLIGVVASAGQSDYWAYSSLDPRGQFLTSLGFQPATELDELIGDEFGAPIDLERYDLINDAGVLIWFTGDTQSSDALYQQLDVYKEGRDIMIGWEDPMAFAFSFNTVLSLPYVLDELVPQIVLATDGDPATK